MDIHEPISLSEAVKLLGLTRQAIAWRLKRNLIPAPVYVGSHPIWERAQLVGRQKGSIRLGRPLKKKKS